MRENIGNSDVYKTIDIREQYKDSEAEKNERRGSNTCNKFITSLFIAVVTVES